MVLADLGLLREATAYAQEVKILIAEVGMTGTYAQ